MSRCACDLHFPIWLGIVPLSAFEDKARSVNRASEPISVGIVPWLLLLLLFLVVVAVVVAMVVVVCGHVPRSFDRRYHTRLAQWVV